MDKNELIRVAVLKELITACGGDCTEDEMIEKFDDLIQMCVIIAEHADKIKE